MFKDLERAKKFVVSKMGDGYNFEPKDDGYIYGDYKIYIRKEGYEVIKHHYTKESTKC